jgi:hypothetical protein
MKTHSEGGEASSIKIKVIKAETEQEEEEKIANSKIKGSTSSLESQKMMRFHPIPFKTQPLIKQEINVAAEIPRTRPPLYSKLSSQGFSGEHHVFIQNPFGEFFMHVSI